MPGKAYTMREMKQIVDYLTEHKLFNEIKGRKMWMELSNSGQIDRSWQSLKETFLKRILPDIHNTYYKLSVQQIASFKQGYDVAGKDKPKLETVTVSDDSNGSGTKKLQNEQPGTSKNIKENKTSGEKTSKIQTHDRTSTETLVLENCYETANDILKDLEDKNENQSEKKEGNKNEKTTLRDLITYSEPLTPMIQEVLHDFTTDDEDDPPMQIVEEDEVLPDVKKNISRTISPGVRESPSLAVVKLVDKSNAIELNSSASTKIKSLKLKKTRKGTWENKSSISSDSSLHQENTISEQNNNLTPPVAEINVQENDTNVATDDLKKANTEELLPNSEKNEKTTQNSGNSTNDTVLPNNQEALIIHSTEKQTSECQSLETKKDSQKAIPTRKRNCSQVTEGPKRKLRKDKELPVIEISSASVEKEEIGKQLEPSTIERNKDENAKKDSVNTAVTVLGSPNIKDQQKNKDNPETSYAVCTGQNERLSKESNSQEAGTSTIINGLNDLSDVNPCLTSVSLFAEQFSNSQYSDPEANDKEVTVADETKLGKVNAQKKTEKIIDLEQSKGSKIKSQQKVSKESEINTDKKNEVTEDNPSEVKAQAAKERGAKITNKTKDNDEVTIQVNMGSRPTKDSMMRDIDEVVILKSHSESETDLFQPAVKKKNSNGGVIPKSQRDNTLANLFGFTSGTTRKRSCSYRDRTTRRYSQRKRTFSRHSTNAIDLSRDTGSSDYSTEVTDSEDTPPAHGNGHLNNRKYMKPKPFDIITEPDGCVFAIHGKKMYPVVHRRTNTLNYLMMSENGDEETESFWKLKYLEESRKAAEEKIRADELARLLQHAKQNQAPKDAPVSPILRSKTSLNSASAVNQPQQSVSNDASGRPQTKVTDSDIALVETKTESEQKTVKIKFNRNNEIELECQWPHVQPVLEQMAHILHKNQEARADKKPGVGSSVVLSSGKTTPEVDAPPDPEVHEKINKLESQIFKEIEELDKSEAQSDINVTQRKRGRPKKVISTDVTSQLSDENARKGRKSLGVVDKDEPKGKLAEQTAEKASKGPSDDSKGDTSDGRSVSRPREVHSDPGSGKRPTRAPRRFEPNIVEANRAPRTRNSSRSASKSSTRKPEVEIPDDSQVLYKFPPDSPTTRSDSRLRSSKSYVMKNPTMNSSPDSSSINSFESTLGYQDSDISVTNIGGLKKKRKLSVSTMLYRGRRARGTVKRKFQLYLVDDTCEADPTSNHLVNSVNVPDSSLNSEEYRSESYQLLLPRKKDVRRQLDQINETSATHEFNSRRNNTNSPITVNIDNDEVNLTEVNNNNSPRPGRNSSNISLPLSPELSMVENISISKDMVSSGDEPTINETHCNDATGHQTDCNKYLISDIDISVPLMEQNCELRKPRSRNNSTHIEKVIVHSPVTDSLVNKISDVNIEEQSSSDSLDLQLRNLLLESAKKIAQQKQTVENKNNEINAMDGVNTVTKEQKKTRAKKRCSTPRKKKDTIKTKGANVEPVIEEHTESCSRGGRQSCPPIINIITCEDAASGETNTDNNNVEKTDALKRKKTKDIIKVKILRPRDRGLPREGRNKRTRSHSRMSVCTDSGINDTESGIFLQGVDDSVELIHNHSETCLHANECAVDSIEFVENTAESAITVDSSSGSLNGEGDCNCKQYENSDMFCNNAQDATDLHVVRSKMNEDGGKSDGGGTVYHTPQSSGGSFNSLVTEDLSEDSPTQSQPKPSKWYLLSEEETTNTNFHDARSNDNANFGANLNQIFPITCAVPNLSTITEMSADNDNSRKATLDNSGKTVKFDSIFDN